MARVMTSGSLSRAGRPVFGCSEAWSSFHQSSTSTYNETKKESRSIATPSFGESLVKHTVWTPSALLRVTHQPSKRPAYSGVHHQEEIYVRYESGEEEFYDLRKDPYQLESRPQDAPASLKKKLEALKNCAEDGCRQAEGL